MRNGRNILVTCVLVLAAGVAWAAVAWAADEKKPTDGAPDPAMAEKMMETWMKMGQPGPQHETLKALVGKFDADVTMQMMPGMPEEKSKGTEENEMLFDGRYLSSKYNGEWKGQPFKGHGLWGYDNAKKKFVSLWIDSMSTMVMMAEGTADASGKAITVKSECMCPMTNKPMAMRSTLTIEDADHHTYESWSSMDGSPEHKSMTIKYTRAK
ncbi:MAG: DUF1579 domain-containing protein [Nitrospira sp.]|nr:DUF1579 domain-containing protein [Nitrospira sp.]